MCIDLGGHHFGGSSFVNVNDFCYYRNCLYNHRYKFSSEKEQVNESQYIVSRSDSVRIRHLGRIGNGGVTYRDEGVDIRGIPSEIGTLLGVC